jgi:hypothetical protein
VYELEADEVGVSLRNASAKVTKAGRAPGNGERGQAACPDLWASEGPGGHSGEPPS